ncbi:MAG: hypothetical protein FWC19_07305 [Treponema sp.]|nr:hypothetical protein [Treponema sp.]MCL2272588.1 hypothetical protein [Treponema sp.]
MDFSGSLNGKKRKNFFLSAVMIILSCIYFTTCENPIMEKWWEEELEYIAIIKEVPVFIYETIIQEKTIYETVYVQLPPEIQIVYVDKLVPQEVLLQYINILDIQFIIFAGESIEFNGPPGREGAPSTTALTNQEKKTNESVISYFAEELSRNDRNCFAIFHGHANLLTGTAEEALELEFISTSRAEDVVRELKEVYEEEGYGDAKTDLENRVTAKGYGGEMSISSSTSSYAGLNRRVEAILFMIETEKVAADTAK